LTTTHSCSGRSTDDNVVRINFRFHFQSGFLVRYLFYTFQFSVFLGEMTHKQKIFEGPFERTWIHVSWSRLVKIARRKVDKISSGILRTKIRGCAGRSRAPLCPTIPLVRLRLIFPERFRPFGLHLCEYTKSGPDRLQFAGVIPERSIFRTPKTITRVVP